MANILSNLVHTLYPQEGHNLIEGETVTPNISDEDLLKIINTDISTFRPNYDKFLKIVETNENYWAGNQLDKSQLKPGEPEIVVNRILMSIETMVAIITSEMPTPWVIVTPEDKKGRVLKDKVERHLRDTWEYTIPMQQRMQILLRIFLCSRIGVLKVFENPMSGEVDTNVVRLENLLFDIEAKSFDDTPMIQYITETYDKVVSRFPEAKSKLEELKRNGKFTDRTQITYVEYWSHYYDDEGKVQSYVCWKYNQVILGKEFNPLWNSKGDNHFYYPKKPYIPLSSLSLGKSVVDDTSLVEQVMPLQDLLNARKRQIHRNAWMANGIFVTSALAMSKENLMKVGPSTNKIYLNKDIENVTSGFAVVTGRPFEQGIFADADDTARQMDNIMGTHETTRGERGASETLGGRAMLREGDFGRLDLTTRSMEQVAEDVLNWWVQFIYVKYSKRRPILSRKEAENSEEEYARQQGFEPKAKKDNENTLGKADFKGHKVKVIVKKGSTRPKDPAMLAEDAVTLMQTGNLDPESFFEMYGHPNPHKAARRLALWQGGAIDKLFPELSGPENMIDVEAIGHILKINKEKSIEARTDINVTPDPEELAKHLQTHTLWMQGAEIDDIEEAYDDLDIELKTLHLEHYKMESDRLMAMMSQMEDMVAQQAPLTQAVEAPVEMPTEQPMV